MLAFGLPFMSPEAAAHEASDRTLADWMVAGHQPERPRRTSP